MFTAIAIFIGGGLGTLLRYCVTMLSNKYLTIPALGTFSVNIIGCLLIGYVLGYISQKADSIPHIAKLFLTVGFLGGLTTFSTFSWEAFNFLKEGKIIQALIYILSSLIIGLVATYIGFVLSKLN